MWVPADKYTLPSLDERIKVKVVILDLKVKIANAVADLAAAQRRLDDLNKELFEREAWVAPVRRLSFDALAIIFTMTSEMDWLAPMVIGSVCRAWRQTVLATPRAWSFIDLKDKKGLGHLPLFLNRSGQIGLHVGLQSQHIENKMLATLVQIAGRIECLSTPMFPTILRKTTFPGLKRLRITQETFQDVLMNLSPSKLPDLTHLDIASFSRRKGAPVDTIPELPPLNSLIIMINDGPTFFNTLKGCANSLTILDLYFTVDIRFVERYTLFLPQLEGMVLDWMDDDVDNVPILVTPKLKSLFADIGIMNAEFPVPLSYESLANLRIRSGALPSPSSLRALQNLQVCVPPTTFIAFLKCLLHDSTICSDLESIEFVGTYGPEEMAKEMESLITKINLCRNRRIVLVFCSDWPAELSDSIVDDQCRPEMPCRR